VSKVLFRIEDHIAYITLNDPENMNSFDLEMTLELERIWERVRDDKNIWVAVLNGEGKAFCAGANVKSMERGKRTLEESLVVGRHRVGPLSYHVYKPIIVAVHKYVLGGAFAFVVESDICIASEDTMFGLPESKVNMPTMFASAIGHFFPHSLASEMMYTGKFITAQRAYEAGLCSRVVPRERLMEEATEMAKSICENGPLANWASKQLYYRGRGVDYDRYLEDLDELATPVINCQDSIEAKQAFIEKRKPRWTAVLDTEE